MPPIICRSIEFLWPFISQIGYGLFVAGLILRGYAIIYLGRFFTTNVAIAADHHVIDSGPYHHIRHPSYAGAALAIFDWCLAVGNWATLAIIFIPALAVQSWRIHVEEKALLTDMAQPLPHLPATDQTPHPVGVLRFTRLFE